jgi:copper chaperone CopZ
MAKVVFQVALEPFDCAGCFKKMEEQFTRMIGITSVNAFPQLGRIRIEFKEKEVSPKQLETIIINSGYQVELKKLTG